MHSTAVYILNKGDKVGTSSFSTDRLYAAIEKKVAKLEGGIDALAAISLRSARYTLITHIPGGVRNILSYEPVKNWAGDLDIYARAGIRIWFKEYISDQTLEDIIISKNIDLVYVAPIHSGTLAVENFNKIVRQSHQFEVPVIFENTAGGWGSIYQPLPEGADYVLTDAGRIAALQQAGIGGFIVEGKHGIFQKYEHDFQESPLIGLKHRRNFLGQRPLSTDILPLAIEAYLDRIAGQYLEYARATHCLALWLSQLELIREVHYPGLDTSAHYPFASHYFKGYYGNRLKFTLWEDGYGHGVLEDYLSTDNPHWLEVSVDNSVPEVHIKLHTGRVHEVFTYFQQIFNHLS